MEYERDIQIDESSLDVEWLNQPRLMASYCEVAAEAHRKMDIAKERIDFVKAQLNQQIRSDPEGFGVVPGTRGITEGSIEAAVLLQEEYQDASRSHIDARYEYEVATGVVRAFDHRKTALENLVRLHGQAYFAGPSVPRDLPAERERRDRDIQGRVRVPTPSATSDSTSMRRRN